MIPPPPSSNEPPIDELISAYLDGEASPEEILLVESNDDLQARLEEIRGIASQVGALSPPPAAQKEAHLAAALGTFDDMFADGTATTATTATPGLSAVPDLEDSSPSPAATAGRPAGTVSLDAARERRTRRFSPSVIAAAAAALMLFVGFAAFNAFGGDTALEVADSQAALNADATEAVETSQEPEVAGGLSDAGTSVSRAEQAESATESRVSPPEPLAQEADEEAMEDEAMADEEAMEDAADSAVDSAGSAAADDQATSPVNGEADADPDFNPNQELDAAFYFGDFASIEALTNTLTETVTLEGLFFNATDITTSCAIAIDELAVVPNPTLTGYADVADQVIEVHVTGEQATSTVYLVDRSSCQIVEQIDADQAGTG